MNMNTGGHVVGVVRTPLPLRHRRRRPDTNSGEDGDLDSADFAHAQLKPRQKRRRTFYVLPDFCWKL